MALPSLGVRSLRTKVDTGARTSSLHAEDITLFRRGRRTWVRFRIPRGRRGRRAVLAEAPLAGHRTVRDSGGRETRRPVIRTLLVLGGRAFEAEVTLADRGPMGYRMLLGRSAVRRRFVVDPIRSYLQGRPHRVDAGGGLPDAVLDRAARPGQTPATA